MAVTTVAQILQTATANVVAAESVAAITVLVVEETANKNILIK